MEARLYHISHPKPLWQVVYTDASKRVGGRSKRIRKHFTVKADAERYQQELNDRLPNEGVIGLQFSQAIRLDASIARERLDFAGLQQTTLTQLADAFIASQKAGKQETRLLAPLLADFLGEKEVVEGCAPRTVQTLRNRLEKWLGVTGLLTVSELSRDRMETLRTRPGVGQQTRRNDMAAVSAWCTWLLDKGHLQHHPLKGLRRPKLPPANKATWTVEECTRILKAAQAYLAGRWLGPMAVLMFTGCRPSELAQTRILYGQQTLARIEGGKLRGRANRTITLLPVAKAWLKAAGSPTTFKPLHARARTTIASRAQVPWHIDVTRHTYISHRLALTRNDAQVAAEAGTSEEMIHRHYHSLKLPKEARTWAAIRPS